MALITTAWIMGSVADVPLTTFDVTANAVTESFSIPAGSYYPWDITAANSALNQLHDEIESHSEITTCSAFFGRDRLPRFTCDVAYTITNWSDTTIRELLGFTGTEAISATSQVPSGLSDYLWSPGRCEIPDAPLGALGLPFHDTAVGVSGDQVVVATTNNSGHRNRFLFKQVYNERVYTSDQLPGEHVRFWDAVQRRFARFKLYRNITEEDSATDATVVNLGAADTIGPYVWQTPDTPVSYDYTREVSRLELFNTIDLPVIAASEY